MGQTKTAIIKETGSSTPKLPITLCIIMLTIIPAAEAPVKSKNTPGIPATLSLTVKTMSVAPSKRRRAQGTIKERTLTRKRKFSGARIGIKMKINTKRKTATNARNTDQSNLPFTPSLRLLGSLSSSPSFSPCLRASLLHLPKLKDDTANSPHQKGEGAYYDGEDKKEGLVANSAPKAWAKPENKQSINKIMQHSKKGQSDGGSPG
jgi:hypothetical protein